MRFTAYGRFWLFVVFFACCVGGRGVLVLGFFVLQRAGGGGGAPHYSVRSTVTPHGMRQKKKALRGEEGENKSFPPSNTTSLYKSYFKTVHWTVFEESLIKW